MASMNKKIRGKRLTREQKEIVSGHALNPADWLYVSSTDFCIRIVHRTKGTEKLVDKFKKMKRR